MHRACTHFSSALTGHGRGLQADLWPWHRCGLRRMVHARELRLQLIAACGAAGSDCEMVNCDEEGGQACSPSRVYRVYSRASFCLMAAGNTPTRKALFDAIICNL